MILPRFSPLLVALAALPAPSAARAQSTTAFAQLTGEAGCLVSDAFTGEDVPAGCGQAPALTSPVSVAVAPDGAQVYVASLSGGIGGNGASGVTVFNRDAGTGGVTFASCITDTSGDGLVGSEGVCADGDALNSVEGLAFAPGGATLYATSPGSSAVSWFARDKATGKLTQQGCVKLLARAGERCSQADALGGAIDVALAPDGAHVYVASFRSSAVVVFKRDAATGALTYQSCVSETGNDGACARAAGLEQAETLAPTADGKALYVLGVSDVAILAVDPATGDLTGNGCLMADAPKGGTCTDEPLLEEIHSATISPDGHSLLVTAGDANVVTFSRDPATGALTQQQCVTGHEFTGGDDDAEASAADGCTDASFDTADGIAVSPDGTEVFVAGESDLGAFRRDPATGALTQFACLNDTDDGSDTRCGTAHEIEFSSALAASADGRNLYVVGSGDSLSVLQVSVAVTSRVLKAHSGRARVALACPALRREGCAGSVNGARFKLAGGRSGSVRVRTGRHRKVVLTVRMKGLTTAHKRLRVQFHGRAARASQ